MGYLRMRGNGWKEGMEAGLGSKGALIPLRPGYLRAMPERPGMPRLPDNILETSFLKILLQDCKKL